MLTGKSTWWSHIVGGLAKASRMYVASLGSRYTLKGGKTIGNLLLAPKDRKKITLKNGVINRFKCDHVGCEGAYVGESAKTFEERFKEHCMASSPIFDHGNTSGHCISVDNLHSG